MFRPNSDQPWFNPDRDIIRLLPKLCDVILKRMKAPDDLCKKVADVMNLCQAQYEWREAFNELPEKFRTEFASHLFIELLNAFSVFQDPLTVKEVRFYLDKMLHR